MALPRRRWPTSPSPWPLRPTSASSSCTMAACLMASAGSRWTTACWWSATAWRAPSPTGSSRTPGWASWQPERTAGQECQALAGVMPSTRSRVLPASSQPAAGSLAPSSPVQLRARRRGAGRRCKWSRSSAGCRSASCAPKLPVQVWCTEAVWGPPAQAARLCRAPGGGTAATSGWSATWWACPSASAAWPCRRPSP